MTRKTLLWCCLALALIAVACTPFCGGVHVGDDFLKPGTTGYFIFWHLRVPRLLTALAAGCLLALAGMVFQHIFRNNLAEPYTMGISTGASAGAVLALKLHLGGSVAGLPGVCLMAFLGALLSVALIIGIARSLGSFSIYILLMSGIALNFFFSSMIVLMQYLVDMANTLSILRWLMGGIAVAGYRDCAVLLPTAALFAALVYALRHDLELISAGDDFAASRGIHVTHVRLVLFVATSLVVGLVVAFIGPIGFIGLIVPHIARLFCRTGFATQLVFNLIGGAALLSLADFLSRSVLFPAELPVGIVTSFLGAPFFLYILIARVKKI